MHLPSQVFTNTFFGTMLTLAAHLPCYKPLLLSADGTTVRTYGTEDQDAIETEIGGVLRPMATIELNIEVGNSGWFPMDSVYFFVEPRVATPPREPSAKETREGWRPVLAEVKVDGDQNDVMFIRNYYQTTALVVVRVVGEDEVLEGVPEAVIKRGIPAHIDNSVAVQHAAQFGETNTLAVLLSFPEVRPEAHENLALRLAAKHGHKDALRVMLDNPKTKAGAVDSEAFRYAVAYGHKECAIMLAKEPDINVRAEDCWAVSAATEYGYPAVLEAILERDPKAGFACQALKDAAEKGVEDICTMLYEADPTAYEVVYHPEPVKHSWPRKTGGHWRLRCHEGETE